MPKLSERWIMERVVWLGVDKPNTHKGKLLPLDEIERKYIRPFYREGARVLDDQMPEHYKRVLYADQIRGLKLDVDESGIINGPTCRLVANLVQCREDHRFY